MRIKRISYKDKVRNWTLEDTTFNQLTLLVGASGVGKTRILRAIQALKEIADGQIFTGISWSIDFETIEGGSYTWEGETDTTGEKLIDNIFINLDSEKKEKKKANLIRERLLRNDVLLVDRVDAKTIYNEKEMPRFSSTESIISILKEEEEIKKVFIAFKKISISDHSSSKLDYGSRFNIYIEGVYDKMYTDLNTIRESNLDVLTKLYLCYLKEKDIFRKIKERYVEIFPYVEDIQVFMSTFKDKEPIYLLSIQIKEKDVSDWIEESNISSGMYRTLIHICEMELCAGGTVFLIDEFENSLGINCLNEITDDILSSGRQVQFIITSHHPYIINNIDFSYWKLVTRKGSVVRTSPITDYISKGSSHDKFMQLIQLTQYQTGQGNP